MIKPPRWYFVAGGFVQIASGLVAVISLGFWVPSWQMKFAGWVMRRRIRRMKESI